MSYPEIYDEQLEATFALPYTDMGRDGMYEIEDDEMEPIDWSVIEEDPQLLEIYTSIYNKLIKM